MRLLTDEGDRESYRRDETVHFEPGLPLAVALPSSTDEVAEIMRLATSHRVPVVPRGAGSGLSGGSAGVEGALTIVLTRMNAILEIDHGNLVAVVQPGVINAALGRAVAEHGLFYPPDPASFEICTIGGNLAEDSGGLRCVKYGVTGDFVLGLEVVLADGAVIRTGGKNLKDVAGYDLTRLFVGSEGTLGVITEATLRLLPAPPPKLTLLAFFDDVPAAGDAVGRIFDAGVVPVTLELMDGFTIRAVDAALRLGLDSDAGAMLMVESDAGGEAAAELDRVAQACQRAGATSVARAQDAQEADWLREARRKAHWSLEQAGVARMDDVGVPRSRVPEMLAAIERVAADHGMRIGVFGHAGDGNLHVNLLANDDPADPAVRKKMWATAEQIFRHTIALGGTLSGEHGIGLTKRDYLPLEHDARVLEWQRKWKAMWDPRDLLNPGKVLPPSRATCSE